MRRALLLVALMLLPLAYAPSAVACGVPCGRIYPLILIQITDKANMWNVTHATPVTIQGTITYKFDMVNEGYTAAAPNAPIEIRFEYPRKPLWADIKVDPEVVPIDVNNPTYVQPNMSEPTNPQASYSYTAPINITISLTGQPVLKDGMDYAKLLVFAKSSESGLYQSGYGIKELRVIPEGAVHESDVAGAKDVFTSVPLPALDLKPVEKKFGGTTVTLTPPSGAKFWEPAQWSAKVDPAPAGRMVFAIHDEAGALVASTAPIDSRGGVAQMNATLAKPGRHTATLTLLPDAGSMTPPITYPLEFDAGSLANAQGFTYPKAYSVQVTESVPKPIGNTADPLAQFQRDIPFFVFDTAQSVAATLTLTSATPVDLGRSVANLQFSLHDPDGNMLQAGSVDPSKPTWTLRVGSVPIEGWYTLRVKGLGAPVTADYNARIDVNYASAHESRNRADGVPDITGGLLSNAGQNLTIPADALTVWAPSDMTPVMDKADGMLYETTVYDANGTLAYASGQRNGASTFSAQAPGLYRAFVYAEPALHAAPFSPVVRAFTFQVGANNTTVASTFAIKDSYEAPPSAAPSLLGYHALRVYAGAAKPDLKGATLVDAEGKSADGTAPGTYFVQVTGMGAPPSGTEMPVELTQTYASAVTLVGPSATHGPASGLPIPGFAVALTLVAVGVLAIGLALARR